MFSSRRLENGLGRCVPGGSLLFTMPSAAVGNNAVQCAIPELGNGSQSETMKQFLGVIDKKVRNMEKKKSKLDDYQARKNKGERLNQDQLEALSKYQEIINNLDFARELQKGFLALGHEVQKAVKKSARREQLQREEMEQRRLKKVLELQYLLDQLGEDSVRQDLKRPNASGSALLTDADLASFDEFYKLVGPDKNCDVRLTDQYEEASQHLWCLLEGRDKPVAGTTYKSLRDTLDKLLISGYFEGSEAKQNGDCETEETPEETSEEQTAVEETAATEEQPPESGPKTESYTEPVQVETTEFFNRQFVPETPYSNTDKDQVEEWTVEAQINSLQNHPPAQLASEPTIAVHQAAPSATDPVVRKQVVQDLMAQMQGTYNFMQVLDPAIVSAQPMKPLQTVDLQQMGGPTIAHSEQRLPQTNAVSGPQDSSQTSMSLSSDQSSAPCSLSTAFPPVSKHINSGGINVNAAPFQSVQAVFNMNAPVPPPTDVQADALKQASQFSGGYGQGFNSQSENTVEQPEIPQERLQSVVGGFQPQDQVMPSAGGHVDPSAGSGFGQSSQSFYSSRGVPRGGPRNNRSMMNGYRGSSNGFRGGYEGYRAPFSTAPSCSGYGQTQFNTSRDYSSYQREGYQQGYKRGTAQGSRGMPRANAQAMRS
ncbi:caprin-1a isoform X2 [Cyprinodon tularosa]|uniref:caprin-1a isoform X2 n=1 Tax=Cyprinodon tularosa TaxID=77115 RepID=UPI0018E27051|nr:caprin-1a isoform X2 [Cyprinodon tularosa]